MMTIREEHNRFILTDLSTHSVKDANQAIEFLTKGNKGRSTASTGQNETSSRSHAIFTINLKRTDVKDIDSRLTNNEKIATVKLLISESWKVAHGIFTII